MTGAQETQVQEVNILVFEPSGGNFLYSASAKTITKNPENSNNDYKFTAKLEEHTGCDIVLITNANSAVQAFLTAQGSTPFTKATLQSGLNLNTTDSYHDSDGKWDTTTPALFPMWGERQNLAIAKNAVIEGIMLHRMVSRINFYVAADNFNLREVYLYNSLTTGAILPNATHWDATWKESGAAPTDPEVGKATAPSLPTGWTYTTSPLIYSYLNSEVTDKTCVNEIYTFEAPAGDASAGPANTYLVIGGNYESSTDITYYRIDIAEKNSAGMYEYLPLLRNHTYEFTLNSVARKGYSTADMAAQAGPENTDVVLIVEHDSELHYFVSDSHYYLGVDQKIVRLPYSISSQTEELKIKTNYPNGWTVKVSDSETDPNVPCTWLTVNTSVPSTGRELSYTAAPNDTWAVRRAYLHISAGVEMVVTIELDSKSAVELPTITPTGDIPAAGQTRTVTLTGLFEQDIPIRARDKYDTQALDQQNAPANAPGGNPVNVILTIPPWPSEEIRTIVFEYQDPNTSLWVIFHEDIQLGYDFELHTTLTEGGVIPEKPMVADYMVTVAGAAWPDIYLRAIDSGTLEVISDPVTIPSGYMGSSWQRLPVYAYNQWNEQPVRNVEFQYSTDGTVWTTFRSGTQKGWYKINQISYKIYHPGTTQRNDISHDGARVVLTINGDFPDGVVEARLGTSEVQIDRVGGDGISANTDTELLCRYNRTLLTRTIPISYRIFVNNSWQPWSYEQSGTGNIATLPQPSIACEMPFTGRIIAWEDAKNHTMKNDSYYYMTWAEAMGIHTTYNYNNYDADVTTRDYPTYGESCTYINTTIETGGCSLYYEGNDPDDPIRGIGNWYLWGDGKSQYEGESQFFIQTHPSERSAALGLRAGTEYWTYGTGNKEYQVTVKILENNWTFAFKYKPLLGADYNIMRTRCVRYPSAGEREQFENGYAPNVVTNY
ncbi:MAG: hypothetical protein LUF85_17330 [Bacteroides sp.]|nr:hypothetical protein [Bacteroides sp.]